MYRIFMSRKLGGQSFNPYHFKYKVFLISLICNSFCQKQLKYIIINRKPFLQNKHILVHRTMIKEKISRTKQY